METQQENTETSFEPRSKTRMAKMYWLRNKYLIATALFLVWMFFFDVKDISSSVDRLTKYRKLQASEEQLSQKIAATKVELGQLKNNAQTIEKYAREKYLMKKDNEDLFIIQEPEAEK